MSAIFESAVEAMEFNSLCSFCGLLKFKVVKHTFGSYSLERAFGEKGYCQWGHTNQHIYVSQGEHNDTMSIIRGG